MPETILRATNVPLSDLAAASSWTCLSVILGKLLSLFSHTVVPTIKRDGLSVYMVLRGP